MDSLLDFLEQHTSLPSSLLQRWICTGQILLNDARVLPKARISEGDAVRLPHAVLARTLRNGIARRVAS